MPRRRRPEENISKSYLFHCAKKQTNRELENIEFQLKQSSVVTKSEDRTCTETVNNFLLTNDNNDNEMELSNVQKVYNEHFNEHATEVDFDMEYQYSDSEVDSEIDTFSIDEADINVYDEEMENPEKLLAEQLQLKIKNWAKEFKVFHNCLKSLLAILNEYVEIDFPKDPRTLLGTPRTTRIENMGHGQYCHIGLTKAVEEIVKERRKISGKITNVKLYINTDGAPIGNSTEKGLWPILCIDTKLRKVKVIGVYYGTGKPENVNDFLRAFTDEAVTLVRDGYQFDGQIIKILISAFICDSPAKAFILNVKYHSGYNSCTKCTIEGNYIKNRMCFATSEFASLRQDDKFRNFEYEDYQHGETILKEIPNLNLVKNIALDSMHCVYIGVVRRLIMLWIQYGPLNVRLSGIQITEISTKLEDFMKILPDGFAKRSRPLKYLKQWKATEYRHFLLYFGPVILKNILPSNVYKHFLMLHTAITILNNPSLILWEHNLSVADKLLRKFVQKYSDIYGPENVTYNVHNLIHLTDEVRFFKNTLDSFSSFIFESYICSLKRLLRKGETPLQQIARRLKEFDDPDLDTVSMKSIDSMRLEKRHYRDDFINLRKYDAQYKILRTPNYLINCMDNKNDCLMLKDESVINVYSFATYNSTSYVIGRKLEFKENLYDKPVLSSFLDIKVMKDISNPLNEWLCSDIVKKMFKIPFGNLIVVFPILHTCESN